MKLLKKIGKECKAIYRDEQGADMLEYILIVAAIALPLLGVIIWFKDDIGRWVGESYNEVKDGGGGTDPLD